MNFPLVPLLRAAGASIALAASLSGCIVVPAQPRHVASAVIVETPPPPPQIEVYGPPPVVGQVWIGGYWGWHGDRHAWNPGHWEAPRQGYHWVPHNWVREDNGWRMHEGHWAR